MAKYSLQDFWYNVTKHRDEYEEKYTKAEILAIILEHAAYYAEEIKPSPESEGTSE